MRVKSPTCDINSEYCARNAATSADCAFLAAVAAASSILVLLSLSEVAFCTSSSSTYFCLLTQLDNVKAAAIAITNTFFILSVFNSLMQK